MTSAAGVTETVLTALTASVSPSSPYKLWLSTVGRATQCWGTATLIVNASGGSGSYAYAWQQTQSGTGVSFSANGNSISVSGDAIRQAKSVTTVYAEKITDTAGQSISVPISVMISSQNSIQ